MGIALKYRVPAGQVMVAAPRQQQKQVLNLYPIVKVSTMTGKLVDIPAINTNTISNPFCIAMHGAKDNVICSNCFSWNMLHGSRKNCAKVWQKNSDFLADEIDWQYLPTFNALWVRFHGHGELQNIAHMVNFHNIALKNPETTFSLWTKRRDIIRQYHREYTQPGNLILIYSNPLKDRIITQPPQGFDKVFNVVTQPDTAENCTGKNCIDCLTCYRTGTQVVIVEREKKRS